MENYMTKILYTNINLLLIEHIILYQVSDNLPITLSLGRLLLTDYYLFY